MWRNSILTLWVCLAVSTTVVGQFGNEWINYDQTYFRLKVAEDGLYRVTVEELEDLGFQADVVSADRLQLYHNGQQVAMLVASSQGRLTHLEFYGQRNDGQLDNELYVSSEAQPHDRYSLFADSSSYFLTYELTGGVGRRMVLSTDNNTTGLTPESYHLREEEQLFTSSYSPGLQFGDRNRFSLSQYDFGEGWTGDAVGKGNSQDITFNVQDLQASGPAPRLEMIVAGGNSLNHQIEILVGPDDTNLRSLGTQVFSDRTSFAFGFDLDVTDIGANGDVLVRMTVVGFDGASDRVSVSIATLIYPQTFNLNGGTTVNYLLTANTDNRSLLQIDSNSPGAGRLFDVTDPVNPIQMSTTISGSSLRTVVNNTASPRHLIGLTNPLSVPSMEAYSFEEIDLSNTNYLIITHPVLRVETSAGDPDPVAAYGAFRSSQAGGNWNVEIANIEDVYDQFTFGVPSPLAIKRMLNYGYSNGDLQFAFLVGKGVTVNFNGYRTGNANLLVPTYGLPGSDMLFAAGFEQDPLLPSVGVGRITARNADGVQAYLEKVIESEATPYDALWRKNILQLTGGQNASELSQFRAFGDAFASTAEGDLLGGNTESLSKQTAATSEFINIREQVDAGLAMITFFGHSGPAVTDIEVDDPEVYENEGRYPGMFLVNGCNAGDIFGNIVSFGEPWILTPNKGSTGFIANVTFATSSRLRRYTDLFYELSFADSVTFGSPIASILNAVAARFFESDPSKNGQSQVYQMVFQGDPAIRLFAADHPDYALETSAVQALPLSGNRILSAQDSFKVEMVIPNFGSTSPDSIEIVIEHTLPNGDIDSVSRTFPRILYQDTLEIFVPNTAGEGIAGNNVLEITIDPDNRIEELEKRNNRISIDVFIANGSTLPLLPLNNAVVSTEIVQLTWQVLGSSIAERSFDFEMDTVPDYSSSFRMSSMETGTVIVQKEVNLASLQDSTVIYWRTRLAESESNEDTLWSEVKFTLIRDGSAPGWGAFSPEQFQEFEPVGIDYNQALQSWQFQQTSSTINIRTHGPNNEELGYPDIQVDVGNVDLITTNNIPDPFCRSNTINAVAFNNQTSNAYLPIEFSNIGVDNILVCGRLPQLIHNFSEGDVTGSRRWLDRLIDEMTTGDQIVLFTIDSVAFSNWDATTKSKLAEVGVSTAVVDALIDGQPIIFFGEKGLDEGDARMITTDNTGRDPTEQVLQFVGNSNGSRTSGSIGSQIIGPALNWQGLTFDLGTDDDDNVNLDVIGIAPGGSEQSLFTNGRVDEIDLSTVDAAQFPNLRLDLSFNDNTSATPPQIRYWHVQYQHPPDGLLIMPDQTGLNLQEGDSVRREFYFYNYTEEDFQDSIQFTSELKNTGNGAVLSFTSTLSGPSAGDSTLFLFKEGTLNRIGSYGLSVRATPLERELYSANNNLTRADFLTVEGDDVNPILDVTFDGTYILNGDIVSPDPLINILLKDQNTILRKSDTTGISIGLRTGDAGEFVPIAFSSPQVNFTPATEDADFNIQYRPGPLEDGRYALRVQGTDESGNAAGVEPYEITFEVVNESSITYFYPYPNPFSTSTRFVFTLTGSNVPDQLKIQIMTVTGRVVREILQDEIGPLKIGNNITQYAWDGRDEYGDQLANGVYLYRVVARINGEDIKNRGTAADQAFKHGFGKLYILR